MKEDYLSCTVGDLFSLAAKTDRLNSSDLSGRTAFGWTGVPVVMRTPYGDARCEVDYVSATQDHEDYIALTPIFKDQAKPKKKEWVHTGKLKTDRVPAHVASPYARIGNDDRCESCGDIIVEK